MDAITRIKIDRDFLDELLRASEDENTRLSHMLADTRAELDQLKEENEELKQRLALLELKLK